MVYNMQLIVGGGNLPLQRYTALAPAPAPAPAPAHALASVTAQG